MILALDVGWSATGWALFKKGILKATGVIATAPAKEKTGTKAVDNARRTAEIAHRLKVIIETCKGGGGSVKGVVAELPHGGSQSAMAIAGMSLATGAVAATLKILGMPVEWVSPTDVKLAMTGKKSATKDEIMDEARDRYAYYKNFPVDKKHFEHIADAIGAYLASKNGNLVKTYG